MSTVSRRGFLVAAAACAVTLAPAVSAASSASAACTPNPNPAAPLSATGKLGTASVSVRVTEFQDVTAIHYGVTNVGSAADTYLVSYTDTVSGMESGTVTVTLAPGQSQVGVLYGSLSHTFVLYINLSDGSTLELEPVGKVPHCAPTKRKYPRPIHNPGKPRPNTTARPGQNQFPDAIRPLGPSVLPSPGGAGLWPGSTR